MAGAQKYIQGKFDQYASCFETLSPPIPESAKPLFCVNGQLLQGYSVLRAETKGGGGTPGELLDYLEDSDIVGAVPASQAMPEKSIQERKPEATKEGMAPLRPRHHHNSAQRPLPQKKLAMAR